MQTRYFKPDQGRNLSARVYVNENSAKLLSEILIQNGRLTPGMHNRWAGLMIDSSGSAAISRTLSHHIPFMEKSSSFTPEMIKNIENLKEAFDNHNHVIVINSTTPDGMLDAREIVSHEQTHVNQRSTAGITNEFWKSFHDDFMSHLEDEDDWHTMGTYEAITEQLFEKGYSQNQYGTETIAWLVSGGHKELGVPIDGAVKVLSSIADFMIKGSRDKEYGLKIFEHVVSSARPKIKKKLEAVVAEKGANIANEEQPVTRKSRKDSWFEEFRKGSEDYRREE